MGRAKRTGGKLRLLWTILKKFDSDHGFFLSSGITFSLLICLIPLLLLLLAFLGTYLYSDREILNHIRHYLERVVPSLDPRIMENLLKIVRDRKIVGILGMAGLIWTSTWTFSSIRISFDLIFQARKGRGPFHGKAIDLFMVLLAGVFLLASMILTSGMTFLQGYPFSLYVNMKPLVRLVLKYVLPYFLTFWMFVSIYKIVPPAKIRFKTAFQSAFFASLLWEVAKQLFGWYILHVGRFSMIYGSLSTLVVFFLWVYYSSVIVLLGGEMVFLLEKGKERGHG